MDPGAEGRGRILRLVRLHQRRLHHHGSCTYTYGIRPALYFSSSLLVSIPDDEDAAPAVDESALFQEYLDYIDAWPEEAEPGTSPMTFEEWKESMKKDGD